MLTDCRILDCVGVAVCCIVLYIIAIYSCSEKVCLLTSPLPIFGVTWQAITVEDNISLYNKSQLKFSASTGTDTKWITSFSVYLFILFFAILRNEFLFE